MRRPFDEARLDEACAKLLVASRPRRLLTAGGESWSVAAAPAARGRRDGVPASGLVPPVGAPPGALRRLRRLARRHLGAAAGGPADVLPGAGAIGVPPQRRQPGRQAPVRRPPVQLQQAGAPGRQRHRQAHRQDQAQALAAH